MKIKSGIAGDALILAFVQGVQILTGFVQTAILSRILSKHDYGTYSQGMLIINFTIPFLLLGLSNAVNYFNNQATVDARKYVNNIFGIVVRLGLLGTVVILLFSGVITEYFGNEDLSQIMVFVAMRPLLQNIISLYLPLYISDGKTKIIAIRNLIISILQVAIITVSTILIDNIVYIFLLLVIMDVAQILIFYCYYNKCVGKIIFYKVDKQYLKPIFQYAVPLAVSTMVGTLSINMDKLLIGKMMSTEEFATYSLMSKELPFSFLVSAFTTVVTPSIIKKISEKRNGDVAIIWKNYVQFGYKITIIMTSGAIICAEELLSFLYSDKYIDGIAVFVVYILVSSIRFTYYGLILSAYGKTKFIMNVSIMTLLCNFVLNILFYNIWGMIGPALASFLTILVCNFLQLAYSCRLQEMHISTLFDTKYLIKYFCSVILVGTILFICKDLFGENDMIRLFVIYGMNMIILFGIHHKSIIYNLKQINIKEGEKRVSES